MLNLMPNTKPITIDLHRHTFTHYDSSWEEKVVMLEHLKAAFEDHVVIRDTIVSHPDQRSLSETDVQRVLEYFRKDDVQDSNKPLSFVAKKWIEKPPVEVTFFRVFAYHKIYPHCPVRLMNGPDYTNQAKGSITFFFLT